MRNILSAIFCLLCSLVQAQSNSLAFNAGPEFNFRKSYHYFYDSLNQRIILNSKYLVVLGINAESDFIHEWKSGIGIQSGLNFKWAQYSNTYAVDSTPLVPPVKDFTNDPYRRAYDSKVKYFGVGLALEMTLKEKLSHKLSIQPVAGFKIGFDVVNKYEEHYYTIDTTGIADPGPKYYEYDLSSTESIFLPDALLLTAGCGIIYKHSQNLFFTIAPFANFTWDFNGSEYWSKLSFPIKLGVIFPLR